MRLFRAALLLAAAPLPTLAQAAPVAPIAYTHRTLANGLQVYAIRDTKTSNVAIQVWYDVGGKDDPRGRSGFAHLFEHLMFKATRNLPSEAFDRLTEDVGGYNNASTDNDYTDYYEVVPANHLQRLLFAEADRMSGLVIDPASFTSERQVVEEEYRLRVLAQPYGKLYATYLPAISYQVHPYARGVIGDIANLDSATIDDVRAFHAIYYRPDNAVLVVAGNFDPAQLDRWVDQYFAPIKRPADAIPRVTAQEPVRTTPVSRTVYEPNTPLPAVMLSYPVPPDRGPDTPALDVLAAVLATGDSSRLYQSLVYRDEIAQEVSANADTRQQAGLFTVNAVMASGKDAAAGEAALRREIARLRDAPPTADELARAKNQLLLTALRERETAEGRARVIASSVIVDGDADASDRQLAAIAALTPADVQRVAREYLPDARSATIRYLPVDAKPAGGASQPITIAATVETRPLTRPADLAIVTPAPAGERIAPPAPGAPVTPAVPQPVVARLANGLTVVTVERHELPLVSAELVATGGAVDPAGRAGTGSLSADLLAKGTATRSATQIAAAAEALGSSLDTGVERDSAHLAMTVRTDGLPAALGLIADSAQHPTFAPDELARSRAQALDAVQVSFQNPGRVAALVANRVVFGASPYGTPLAGTPASLKAVTQADVRAAWARTWTPATTTLVVTGDVTPARAQALAQQALGSWRAAAPAAAPLPAPAYPAPRVVVVNMPGAGQAGVAVVRPAITRRDPAYYSDELANAVLGGGFSARLNEEIRIKRGLSYGANSGLSARRAGGDVAAFVQTKNPSAPEVVRLIETEMTRLGQEPVPAAELDARKATLIGEFGRAAETDEGLAGTVGSYVAEGVPLDEIARYAPTIAGLDAPAVQAAAKRLLDPAPASIVVVGDARQFADELRKAYPQLEVIPAAQLDLDSATLTK